ncbi:MAG TPA: DUF4249 domain-containing protein [Puia sp.]|nr:DUF4249 domain-containing protein [Puia sp.]
MKTTCHTGIVFFLIIVCLAACREPYTAPLVKGNASYLVVEGFLNAGPEPTIITLSRTRRLGDSIPHVPELNAQVSVIGEFGELYAFSALSDGVYSIQAMNLNPGEKYRLQILTANGKKYLSDSVAVTPTPAIDSISWKQDTTSASSKLGVTIYTNTHDPMNNTKYYRWEYEETWEYHTIFDSFFDYSGGTVVPRTDAGHIFSCWRSQPSTSLILASSAKLSQDIIYENPIQFIPIRDQRMGVRYSILVKQFAMSKAAYEYWENLKKNTELTGSLFDPQPSQPTGNIRCVTDPQDPVLGFVSASTVQEQRIFVANSSLEHWGFQTIPDDCPSQIVPPDSFNYFFAGKQLIPVSQVPNSPNFVSSRPACIDCTLQGGSSTKPVYWP